MTVSYNENSLADCLCEDCPTCLKSTYPKGEGVFCATGRRAGMENKKGCLCRKCFVYSANNLSREFFCIDGAATD